MRFMNNKENNKERGKEEESESEMKGAEGVSERYRDTERGNREERKRGKKLRGSAPAISSVTVHSKRNNR